MRIGYCGRRRFRNESPRHGVLSVVNVCEGNASDHGRSNWIQGERNEQYIIR